jgi:hypothetical protein
MKTLTHKFLSLACAVAALAGVARADFITVGTDADNRILTDTRWTRDNVYILGRVIIVANGAKLTIEPGTIIRGAPATLTGYAEEPGTIVVARGGKIIANGTADDPIIFTSLKDTNVPGGAATIPASWVNLKGNTVDVSAIPLSDYTPGGPEGDNGFNKSGLWGGIILSGRGFAACNTQGTDTNSDGIWDAHAASLAEDAQRRQNFGVGTDFPEGLASGSGSNVLNAPSSIYGGTDDDDSSGVLRFVVNRYGGFVLGAAAVGNEINAFTFCAQGSGTVLEHIECFQNKDDGFEFFGGKCNTRFLFSDANQDDSFDADEGYRGIHQFWTVIQGTINATPSASLRSGFSGNQAIGQTETAADYQYDKLMEVDGPEPNDGDRLPETDLTVFNFTFLAGGTKKEGLQPRNEAKVAVHNGIVENTSTMMRGSEAVGGTRTTRLTWSNIYTFNTTVQSGSLNVVNTAVGTTTGTGPAVGVSILTQLTALQSQPTSSLVTPWTFSATATVPVPCPLYTKNGLDLRLAPAAAARNVPLASGVVLPSGYVNTGFAGSMCDNLQLFGWSSLSALDVLPTTNLARPAITMSVTNVGGGTFRHQVSFPSAGATVRYVVERSFDGKSWTVMTTNPLSGAGTLSFVDPTTPADDSALYRVYGL